MLLLLDSVRFQGGHHCRLSDHFPRFRARVLNPAGKGKFHRLTHLGLDALEEKFDKFVPFIKGKKLLHGSLM